MCMRPAQSRPPATNAWLCPAINGKITARQVRKAVEEHRANASHEHEVQPGMVYISNPTEVGTLYNKEELTELSAACYELGLYLFVDGARMAYGLTSPANDLSLQDYAALCDVFYLGGTKCGALFGEAVVITNDDLKPDFRYCISSTAPCWPRAACWVAVPGPAGRRGRRRDEPVFHDGTPCQRTGPAHPRRV